MKSVQRRFGKMMKRSDNEADVQTVLDEFQAIDKMLDFMIKELKAWRNGWEDVLKYQYDTSEALANLYKPLEPASDPEMRHQPAETPAKYMQKCLGLQKECSDMKTDLAQEIAMIDSKLIRPVEEAKKSTKMLHKTVKHRDNCKVDYERYLGRAEHVRNKETRSQKEEAALAAHESKLAQAQIDYQTADEQVRETFPPVSAAVLTLLPYILASMVTLQTTLIGQIYTVLDAYTKRFGLPNPAPADAEVIATWDHEFTSFRRELESDLQTIANGKAVNLSMTLGPEKDKSTITGLGIRNKVMSRGKSNQSVPVRPAGSASVYSGSGSDIALVEQGDESGPPKPPRPGAMPSPAMPSPAINMSSKPRMPSTSSFTPSSNGNSYDSKPPPPYPASPSPGYTAYKPPGGAGTPSSQYEMPANGISPPYSNPAPDYFAGTAARASQASLASSTASIAAAKKKKPPPPVPAKRNPSSAGPQFVTALFDFDGQGPGDLAFREGDRIRVVRKTGSTDDWWDGELNGRTGAFPANYVQV